MGLTYFCFVTTLDSAVRHLVVLDSLDVEAAQQEARRAMAEHETALMAEIYEDDRLIAQVQPSAPPMAAS